MSVEEMLAAARAEKSGAAKPDPKVSGGPAKPAAPAASPAGGGKVSARNMSVEEMLAAARAEKSAQPAPAKAAAAVKPAGKPKPVAAKAAPSSSGPVGPRETSSILAAARKPAKRGPMSKAEAAKQGQSAAAPAKVIPKMPEKPAYAKPKPPQPVGETRRGFVSVLFGSFLAVGFTSLAAVSGLWGLGLARFMFPNILTEPPSQFKVGFPADFPPDGVATKFKAQFGVWVVNTEYEGERQIVALKSVCTHLGCTPNWLEGEQKFKCPCHGSGFYKDGINFEGPAPRPLERYAIRIADDGQLEIDKSRTFQQEMGQWNDSSCYVPV